MMMMMVMFLSLPHEPKSMFSQDSLIILVSECLFSFKSPFSSHNIIHSQIIYQDQDTS